MKTDNIVGFYLTHTVNGRSTRTRFERKDLPLLKQWIDICKARGFPYTAEAIVKGNDGYVICRLI
ncbi:MAG: hypothetical protein IJL85_07590 [Erysipelotrichaceae bacterium]|nr:hypothetical protein [Erysipelotrichaceae bacterium]